MLGYKKDNKRGFTLIELLTTILILALILALAIPSYNAIIKKNKAKAYDAKKNLIILAAEKYATEENLSGVTTISVNKLIKEGYVAADKAKDFKIYNDINQEEMNCYTIKIDVTSEQPKVTLNEDEKCDFVQEEIASEIITISTYEAGVFSDFNELNKASNNITIGSWFTGDVVIIAEINMPLEVLPGDPGYKDYQTQLNYYNEFKGFAYLLQSAPTPVPPAPEGDTPEYKAYKAYLLKKDLYETAITDKDKIRVRWTGQTVTETKGNYNAYCVNMFRYFRGLIKDKDGNAINPFNYNVTDARVNLQLINGSDGIEENCKNCLFVKGSPFYRQTYTVEFIHENGHVLRKNVTIKIDQEDALAVATVNPKWEYGGLECNSTQLDKCTKEIKVVGSDKNGSGIDKVAIREVGDSKDLVWQDLDKGSYKESKNLGTYNIYTQDKAGNISDIADTVTVDKIDSEAPIVKSMKAVPSTWTNQPVTLYGNAIDKDSGLKEFVFTKNNLMPLATTQIKAITNQEQEVKQEIAANHINEGEIDWYLHIKDDVGRYTVSTATVKTKIDVTPPTINFTSVNGTNVSAEGINNHLVITATCDDGIGDVSGVKNISLTKSLGGATTGVVAGTTASININEVGADQYVTATCTDNAGNVTTKDSPKYTLYEVTVTFDKNGADSIGDTERTCISYNGIACSITLPTITRASDVVLGWSDIKTAHDKSWDQNTAKLFTTSDDYFAVSYFIVNIIFDKNEATAINGIAGPIYGTCYIYNNEANCSNSITSPTITRGDGYSQYGWSTTKTSHSNDWEQNTNKSDFTKTSDNTTYYAITKKQITINFNKNGATTPAANTTPVSCDIYNAEGSCTIRTPNIARTSYSPVGWGADDTSTTPIFNKDTDVSVTPTTDTSLHAITKRTITISFYKNGVDTPTADITPVSCDIYNAMTSCTIDTPNITRSGYNAIGWGADSTSTGIILSHNKSNVSITTSTDTSLHAITRRVVTVYYNPDNGSSVSSDNYYIYNSDYTVSFTVSSYSPSKSGFTFQNAWKDSYGLIYNSGSFGGSISADLYLTAIYVDNYATYACDWGDYWGSHKKPTYPYNNYIKSIYTDHYGEAYFWWGCSGDHNGDGLENDYHKGIYGEPVYYLNCYWHNEPDWTRYWCPCPDKGDTDSTTLCEKKVGAVHH